MAMLGSRGSGPPLLLLLLQSAAVALLLHNVLIESGASPALRVVPLAQAFSPSSAPSSSSSSSSLLPPPIRHVIQPHNGHGVLFGYQSTAGKAAAGRPTNNVLVDAAPRLSSTSCTAIIRSTSSTGGPFATNASYRTTGRPSAKPTRSTTYSPFWRLGNGPSSNRSSRGRRYGRSTLSALPFDEDGPIDNPVGEDNFDAKTTVALVGGQSALVIVAVIAAALFGTPNLGLGSGFGLTADAVRYGTLATVPLFVLAYVLDFVEKGVPALQDVTKATQRSVLALLGRRRKPIVALGTALALGAAAGLGEEMLFRGVLQTELSSRLGDGIALGLSSIIFGALHAVTPLYAALASLASVFFGYLYVESQNLAVPIVCHGLYDVGALLWAHWTVTDMSYDEQSEIINWAGPDEPNDGNKQ